MVTWALRLARPLGPFLRVKSYDIYVFILRVTNCIALVGGNPCGDFFFFFFFSHRLFL